VAAESQSVVILLFSFTSLTALSNCKADSLKAFGRPSYYRRERQS
jgi:hypothetical protein